MIPPGTVSFLSPSPNILSIKTSIHILQRLPRLMTSFGLYWPRTWLEYCRALVERRKCSCCSTGLGLKIFDSGGHEVRTVHTVLFMGNLQRWSYTHPVYLSVISSVLWGQVKWLLWSVQIVLHGMIKRNMTSRHGSQWLSKSHTVFVFPYLSLLFTSFTMVVDN